MAIPRGIIRPAGFRGNGTARRHTNAERRHLCQASAFPPEQFDGSTLVLEVPNQFYVDWLDQHYRHLIENSVAAVAERSVGISFHVRPEAPAPQREFRASVPHPVRDESNLGVELCVSRTVRDTAALLDAVHGPGVGDTVMERTTSKGSTSSSNTP
jgi:chromosomal replication initiation ATPase DnaA